MDDNFGAGVVVEFNEHAVIPNVKTAIEITARHKLINPSCFLSMVIIYSSLFFILPVFDKKQNIAIMSLLFDLASKSTCNYITIDQITPIDVI